VTASAPECSAGVVGRTTIEKTKKKEKNRKDVVLFDKCLGSTPFQRLGAVFFFFFVVKYCQILTSNGQLLPSNLRKNFF
jgi:hypothetical protein